jgi:hypothetical protein
MYIEVDPLTSRSSSALSRSVSTPVLSDLPTRLPIHAHALKVDIYANTQPLDCLVEVGARKREREGGWKSDLAEERSALFLGLRSSP